MNWIVIAEQKRPVKETPVEARVKIEDLIQGNIFSINSQATKFELQTIDVKPATGFPHGRVMARTVHMDGSYGGDAVLDYGEHRGYPVLLWNSIFGASADLGKEYELYERVQLKGSDLKGTILDLNKSKFPDCDIIVMWDSPLHGDPITEVHGHEMESLGEKLNEQEKVKTPEGQETTLAALRAGVMDLRGKHEKKYEDKTKEIVQQQIAEATSQHQASLDQVTAEQKAEIGRVCAAIIEQHSGTCRAITDACVMNVSAGSNNYEIEKIGDMLTNYADSVYHLASRLTSDLSVASAATREVLNIVADAAWKSFFLTRLAYIRKQPNGQYCVFSEKGKRMGCYGSKEKAQHRLQQIEYFKRKGAEVDLDTMDSLDDVRL